MPGRGRAFESGSVEFEIGAERSDEGDPAFHPDDHDPFPLIDRGAVDRRGGYVLPREPGFYEASVWCDATKTWHHSGTVSRLELLDWANCLEMLRQPV